MFDTKRFSGIVPLACHLSGLSPLLRIGSRITSTGNEKAENLIFRALLIIGSVARCKIKHHNLIKAVHHQVRLLVDCPAAFGFVYFQRDIECIIILMPVSWSS